MSDTKVYYDLTAGYIVAHIESAYQTFDMVCKKYHESQVKLYMREAGSHKFLWWTIEDKAIDYDEAEKLYISDGEAFGVKGLMYQVDKDYNEARKTNLDHLINQAQVLPPDTIIHVPTELIYFFTDAKYLK